MRTPKLAIIILSVITLFSACKNDPVIFNSSASTTTTTSGGTTTTTTSPYYFKGTLSGQAIDWQVTDGVNGWVTGSNSNLATAGGAETGGLAALISASSTFKPQIAIGFGTYTVAAGVDKSTYFNSFITTGSWAFGTTPSYTPGAKQLAIAYTDAQGNNYTSVGPQTGTATVVAVTPIPASTGVAESLQINMTFSCILYPVIGSGSTLTLTNAQATILLENLL